MARTWRTAGRVAAIGALALLLSACLKLDIDLQVQADNTVSGGIIFGVDKQLLELTGGSVEDILGTSAPIPEDVEGVTTEPFEDDTFVGQQFSFEGVPLEEFSSGDLVITREGEVFRVSGALDLSSGLDGATGLSGLTGPFSPEELLQGAEMQVRMTFPGEVTESNGEVDGNTVTWIPVV
ncbi:MAG: LppM family (lipo)protein, partial [Actinomycetota bacterium]